MKVTINKEAYKNHRFPDWPWYLGTWSGDGWWNAKYVPSKYESMQFEVMQDEVHPDKWLVIDEKCPIRGAWIDKDDSTPTH